VPGSADRPGRSHAPDQPDASEMPGQLRTRSPRPEPDRADEARPADAARGRAGDERVPWSRADLQHRLERLPPGHPSSPRAVDADIPRRGDGSEREPDGVRGDYWSEVPRFLRAWADHLRRWPAERAAVAVDRSRDPEGSWRGDGNQYLSPDQHAETKNVIARVQQTEEALTKRMGDAERENSSGGWLAGLEFRLKGEDRLKEKIAEKIEHEPDRTPAEAVREINDAIRYTFSFESGKYTDGYWDLKQGLEANGFTMIYSKNHWRDDPEYKGVNTRWVTAEGQRFEVQFHTAESFHAKQEVTHEAYERSRNRLSGRSERRELEAFQREVCTFLTVPARVESIPDYKEEDS
jgi:hypothetical protein